MFSQSEAVFERFTRGCFLAYLFGFLVACSPATRSDVGQLRNEVASLRNEVRSSKQGNAAGRWQAVINPAHPDGLILLDSATGRTFEYSRSDKGAPKWVELPQASIPVIETEFGPDGKLRVKK